MPTCFDLSFGLYIIYITYIYLSARFFFNSRGFFSSQNYRPMQLFSDRNNYYPSWAMELWYISLLEVFRLLFKKNKLMKSFSGFSKLGYWRTNRFLWFMSLAMFYPSHVRYIMWNVIINGRLQKGKFGIYIYNYS